MSNLFATTFYFKEIFKDYEEFKSFVLEYTALDNEDLLHSYLFLFLYNQYCNSNINYDTPQAFKRHFGITYANFFTQYKVRKERIDKIYALTDEDLVVVDRIINAIANNPSSTVPNALDTMLDYVDQQTGSKTVKNKLESYLDALNKMTDLFLYEFLNKFKKHFISIYAIENIVLREVEDD